MAPGTLMGKRVLRALDVARGEVSKGSSVMDGSRLRGAQRV